ncbi:MAG: NAD(+) kinase [Thermoplasmata archaeon]|nr:NAD(+) kinase [Thermoplasmata archaeon]
MKFGIVANIEISRSINIAKYVYDYLNKNHEVLIETKTAKKMHKSGVPIQEMDVDIIITIGGDGTVLKTLQNTNRPIFSINLGKLGFLTEVVPVDLDYSLERLINGNYFLDKRKKLKVMLNDKRLADCTNEVVIHTSEISKLRTYAIYIDKELLEDLRADGIIIATATGSTSYALSTGGPIVDPRIDAMVIAYIAPFKLSIRSHVVPSKSELEIHLLDKTRKSMVVLDGQLQKRISHKDVVRLSESENEAVFVRFNLNFYEKLREKIL